MTNSVRIGKKSNLDRIFFSLGAGGGGDLDSTQRFPFFFLIQNKTKQKIGGTRYWGGFVRTI